MHTGPPRRIQRGAELFESLLPTTLESQTLSRQSSRGAGSTFTSAFTSAKLRNDGAKPSLCSSPIQERKAMIIGWLSEDSQRIKQNEHATVRTSDFEPTTEWK